MFLLRDDEEVAVAVVHGAPTHPRVTEVDVDGEAVAGPGVARPGHRVQPRHPVHRLHTTSITTTNNVCWPSLPLLFLV